MYIDKLSEICENTEYKNIMYYQGRSKKGWGTTCKISTKNDKKSIKSHATAEDAQTSINLAAQNCLNEYIKTTTPCADILIKKVSKKTTAREIRLLCTKFGTVIQCSITDKYAGLVKMKTLTEAQQLILNLQGFDLNGTKLSVCFNYILTEIETSQLELPQLETPQLLNDDKINNFIDKMCEQIFYTINNNSVETVADRKEELPTYSFFGNFNT